mmetsp:Transcript_11425/g.17223  ORF Transcript_11425/g.17223 Transcript_11425/m.17223 type:complete len:90 (-) Transcript_11425:308-577(-)
MRKIQRVMEESSPGQENADEKYIPPFFADIVAKGKYDKGKEAPTVVNSSGHNFKREQADLIFSFGNAVNEVSIEKGKRDLDEEPNASSD